MSSDALNSLHEIQATLHSAVDPAPPSARLAAAVVVQAIITLQLTLYFLQQAQPPQR